MSTQAVNAIACGNCSHDNISVAYNCSAAVRASCSRATHRAQRSSAWQTSAIRCSAVTCDAGRFCSYRSTSSILLQQAYFKVHKKVLIVTAYKPDVFYLPVTDWSMWIFCVVCLAWSDSFLWLFSFILLWMKSWFYWTFCTTYNSIYLVYLMFLMLCCLYASCINSLHLTM